MLSNLSIKMKLQILTLSAILLVSILVATVSIFSINKLSEENIESFKKDAYSKKEEELKNYVSLAMKTVDSYYKRTSKDKVKIEVQSYLKEQTGFLFSILEAEYKRLDGKVSEEFLKGRLKDIVKATRYGKSGYFWINDTDSVIVMHPIKPALDGKNLREYKDKGGKLIFKEFADVASRSGEGFVDYVWPKPGFEKPQDKVSFVKLFKQFGWVIGTGEYVANVTAKMQEEALKTIAEERYGKDGYFWINDSTPKTVMHPIKPSLNGKDLSKIKDKAGKLLFNEMSKVANANANGGLVKYMWAKPGKDAPQQKFSYVQRFEQWDWIIGTGAYVDDIEDDIIAMQLATEKEIKSVITTIVIFNIVAIILISLLSAFLISSSIIKPLKSLNQAIQYLISNNEERRKDETIRKVSNDEIGDVTDSFNTYLGNLRDIAKQDSVVIEEVEDVITKVNNGFYVYKVTENSENPLVQKLKNSINEMIDKTNEKLEEINNTLLEYGKNNFDYKVSDENKHSSNGIIGSIATSTELLGGTVSEYLAMITTSGEKLNDNTSILSSSVSNFARSANEQAASLEETAAAVEEITGIIKNNSEKVDRMSILANDLNSSSQEGESLASRTTSAMDEIDTQVSSINDAITVIDQIAFQTNILSLNAAVEAATAGEAGKGFAVVAQEVRNLASRSAEAAKEIKDIVEAATTKAKEGKTIAGEMIGGYTELNSKISETIALISDVTDASREQETGIVQINDAINSLDQATQVNASSATEINGLSNEVLDLSKDLLSIADRADFDISKKKQICDIDLVFQVAKSKNDHIVFKNTNFAKVSDRTKTWAVTQPTECNLGKWILEQESLGIKFTKSANWSELKEAHNGVHNSVQNYIDENAKYASNDKLVEISRQVEENTHRVFMSLDILKEEHCSDIIKNAKKSKTVKEETPRMVSSPKIEVKPKEIRKEKVEPVKREVSKRVKREISNPVIKEEKKTIKDESKPIEKQVVVPNNTDEDDEWESF